MTRSLVLASTLAFFGCTVTDGAAQQERAELQTSVQRLEERLQRMDRYLQTLQSGQQQQVQDREKAMQQMQQEMAELRSALRKREEEAAGANASLQAELSQRERTHAEALERQKVDQAKAQEEIKRTTTELHHRTAEREQFQALHQRTEQQLRERDEQAKKAAQEAKELRTALERTRAETERARTEAAATLKKDQDQRERRLHDLEERAVKAEAARADATAMIEKVRAEAMAAQRAAVAERSHAEQRAQTAEDGDRRESARQADRAGLLAKIAGERAMLQDLRASIEHARRQQSEDERIGNGNAAKRIAALERANAELRAALDQARESEEKAHAGGARNPDDEQEGDDDDDEGGCQGCTDPEPPACCRPGRTIKIIIHNGGGEVHLHLDRDTLIATEAPTPIAPPPALLSPRPDPRLGTSAPGPRVLRFGAPGDRTTSPAREAHPPASSGR